MDFEPLRKRHPRRGRQTRRRHQATFDSLPPGRAPIGVLTPFVATTSSRSTTPALTVVIRSSTSVEASSTQTPGDLAQSEGSASGIVEQLPLIQPPLIKHPAMSSFGAMARAAEYNAARNASQRQVSREAEEQKLPPKPIPISLSAFTKTQQSTRNKGAKAWKPLTLDDIGGGYDDEEHEDSGRETPLTTPMTILVRNTKDSTKESGASVREQTPIARITAPAGFIPTGPRAITDARDRSIMIATPVPQRAQQHPVLSYPSQQLHSGMQDHPVFTQTGLSPYFVEPPYFYLPNFAFSGTPQNNKEQLTRDFARMISPEDMSPTKQEQKLALLSQTQPSHTRAFISSDCPTLHHPPSTGANERTLPPLQQKVCSDNGYDAWYLATGRTIRPQRGMVSGSDQAHDSPRNLLPSDTRLIQNKPEQQPVEGGVVVRHPSDTRATAPTNVQTHEKPQFLLGAHPATVSSVVSDEPYDRKGRMQNYVAAATQEAMAKTSKTVLHNPELYRSHRSYETSAEHFGNFADSVQSTPKVYFPPLPWDVKLRPKRGHDIVPWEVMPPTSVQKEIISKIKLGSNLSSEQVQVLARAINNPAPGLTLPELEGCNDDQQESREPLEEEPVFASGIALEEWLEVKAPTRASRERTRKLMAKASADISGTLVEPGFRSAEVVSQISHSNLTDAQEWFHKDNRGARPAAWGIAEEHAIRRNNEAAARNGGIMPPGFNDGFCANLLLAEVALNITSYHDKPATQQRDNFFKVRPVPEYAIERGGLGSSGGRQSTSYFDDDQEEYFMAPIRIARDPRFRPQGKEVGKIKLDEEWKHRHDLYGRKLCDGWN